MKKKIKRDVAFKMHLENTFHYYDILKICLLDFGFPLPTIWIIMHYINSLFLSILWNRNKMLAFKYPHGLRQGDPLSLYIFIIYMEMLFIAKRTNFSFILEKIKTHMAS